MLVDQTRGPAKCSKNLGKNFFVIYVKVWQLWESTAKLWYSQSPRKKAPAASGQASVCTSVVGCWWRKAHLQLKDVRRECHHSMSSWNFFAEEDSREFIISSIRWRKVRPPYTTRQAQLSLPASCWSCFSLALRLMRNREINWWSSASLLGGSAISQRWVSNSTPRNTSFCVGPMTLHQLMWKPRSWSSFKSTEKASWHSALDYDEKVIQVDNICLKATSGHHAPHRLRQTVKNFRWAFGTERKLSVIEISGIRLPWKLPLQACCWIVAFVNGNWSVCMPQIDFCHKIIWPWQFYRIIQSLKLKGFSISG